MTREKYDELWGNAFYPKTEQLCRIYSSLRFDTSRAAQIYDKYESVNSRVHELMADPSGRIDRHKIASAMIEAILQILPFSGPDMNGDSEQKFSATEYLPNETWAWHCALSIVLSFRVEELKREGRTDLIQIARKGFEFPECKHGEYQEHALRSLYFSRISGTYDLFSFSHILFLVEAYSITFHTSSLVRKPPV